MIFKQGVSKDEWFKFVTGHICHLILPVTLIVGGLIQQEPIKDLLLFLLICFIPLYILIWIVSLSYLEWFHIYHDRIEARGVWGKKNVVYFEKVTSVEETMIKLTARGTCRPFYIFHDGRVNNKSILDLNSCYNKKRFTFRIHKTPKIESFLKSKGYLESE